MLRRTLVPAVLTAGLVIVSATAAGATEAPADRLDRTGSPLPDRADRSVKRVGPGAASLRQAPEASGYFEPLETIVTGSWPENVAIGDVTGDGRNDVLMTTSFYFDEENDYKLFVSVQRPDGSLEPPVKYDTLLGYTGQAGLAVLDATGDGRSDVALTTENGVQILAQTADGKLADRGLLAGTPDALHLAAADLDGDGDTDLLAATRAGIRQLTQGPAGAFTISTVSSEQTTTVRVGDLNRDGRPDAVGFAGYYATVYRNLADGWRRQTPLTSPERINGLEVADVTGEGRADIVVSAGGNRPASQVVVFSQRRNGTFAAGVAYPVADIPEPIRAADITGDGRTDLVTAHGGWNTLTTLRQQANRTLAAPVTDPLPYATSYASDGLAVGDVNGDGRPDVVIADYNHGLLIARNARGNDLRK